MGCKTIQTAMCKNSSFEENTMLDVLDKSQPRLLRCCLMLMLMLLEVLISNILVKVRVFAPYWRKFAWRVQTYCEKLCSTRFTQIWLRRSWICIWAVCCLRVNFVALRQLHLNTGSFDARVAFVLVLQVQQAKRILKYRTFRYCFIFPDENSP